MPLDTFICGSCLLSFNEIDAFINHKRSCHGPQTQEPGTAEVTAAGSQLLQREPEVETMAAINTIPSIDYGDKPLVATEGVIITESEANSVLSGMFTEEDLLRENHQTVIILQGDLPNLNLENATEQLLSEIQAGENKTDPQKNAKKRGRPRKADQRVEKPKFDPEEKNEPEIGPDGRLICTRCKRSFHKGRVFNAHKCLAVSDYVDLSNPKELVKANTGELNEDETMQLEEEIQDAGAMDLDTKDADYRAPLEEKVESDDEELDNQANVELGIHENEELRNLTDGQSSEVGEIIAGAIASETLDKVMEDVKPLEGNMEKNSIIGPVEVQADPDVDSSHVQKPTDAIDDVPVFQSEEDKALFEQSLNVDLSGVDSMFRTHCIYQDLNEYARTSSRMLSNELLLYSCNTCDKVFKTVSHMRLHCLIHTDLKPFRCHKCQYSSNCRGNLYSHMRKHTGQYYKCDKCKFKTVNKSHLLEHEMTHSGIRHMCELCKKDYNTQKSLMNHVRKYHTSKKGREYLSKFMQTRDPKGSTVIHQCHVCNRKFKKKIDRDRHLFVHDIKDIPNIQHCMLCDYTASRKLYLEKHFLKHRCIYRCFSCEEKFLSSLKLIDHLTSVHVESSDSLSWERMFEESINHSLYLPEPDSNIVNVDKDKVNLPPELSESVVAAQSKQAEQTEEQMSDLNSADKFINKEPVEKIIETSDDAQIVDDSALSEDASAVIKTEAEELPLNSKHDNPEVKEQSSSTEKSETIPNDKDASVMEIGDTAEKDTTLIREGEEGKLTSEGELGGTVGTDENEMTEDGTDRDEISEAVQDIEQYENQEEFAYTCRATEKVEELIDRLGYLPMTVQIFQKMRDTFGNEECEFCGRLFFSKVDYEPHVRTHTGDKPEICMQCGYKAITKDNLKRHIERDHEKIIFSCKECDFQSSSRTVLWNHQMKHTGLMGLECHVCQRQISSLKELRNHVLANHPESSKEELDKLTGNFHKAHGKMGRRSFKCPYCDKIYFRANSDLQRHMWIHEGIKPFKCPLCPYSCRSKNNLQAHMIRHSKDKPFACSECGKTYKSMTALRWHIRSHSGKLFKCSRCPYEASQQSHLKRHLETHNLVKRYKCTECDYSANTLGYLKIHYTRLHKGVEMPKGSPAIPTTMVELPGPSSQDKSVYKCLSCDYLFGNLSDLKRHLKLRHHVEVKNLTHMDAVPSQEVQVMYEEGSLVAETSDHHVAMETAGQANLDEKTVSAVNILQHIIDMSNQGAFNQQQSESAQILNMNPETIIVQQEGDQVLVANGDSNLDNNQYVIQYVTQQEEGQVEELNMVEVQTDGVEGTVLEDLQTEAKPELETEIQTVEAT